MHIHSSDGKASDSANHTAARAAGTAAGDVAEPAAVPAFGADSRLLARRTVQQLQSSAGNQAVLSLWRKTPRDAAPAQREPPAPHSPQPTIQRLLSNSDWRKFVVRYGWNATIAQWAANLGNDWAHALNILNLGVAISAESEADLQQFIAAGGGGTGPYDGLTSLSSSAKSRGTIPELSGLLTAAGGPNANLTDATDLVKALPDGATLVQATGLVSAVVTAKGSLRDAMGLAKVVPAGATVADAGELVKAVQTAGGKVVDATGFLQNLPNTAKLPEAIDLVKEVSAAKGTWLQAMAFVDAAKTRGTLGEARKLITTAQGAHQNIATLTKFVTSAPPKAAMTELTTFLAAAQTSKGDSQQMSLLISAAAKVGTTLDQLTALMPASQKLGGSIAELNTLITGMPKGSTGDDVKELLEVAQPAQGTLVLLGNLAKAAPKSTTVKQLSRFVGVYHTAGGTVLQSITFITAVGQRATLEEQITLFSGEPKVQAADALAFVKLALKPATIKTITASLLGVKHEDALQLTAALQKDGLAEADLNGVLDRLTKEGKKGPEVLATLKNMRGTLEPDATSNLDPLTPQGAAGTRVLSGPQIASHIKGLPPPKQKGAGYESQYPTGKPVDNLDIDTLFTHLDRNPLADLKGSSKTDETVGQIAARRAQALARLKTKTNAAWVDAVFNLYEYSGKQFALTSLRDVVKPLCPALSALQVTTMVQWLTPLTGDEVVALLKALNDGLTGVQMYGLLSALHSAPVSYNGTQIRDLVTRLRGNLAVVGAEPKQLRSILTPLAKNKDGTTNADSAGERLLTSEEVHAHLTSNTTGLPNNQPVPNFGNLYPTGQDYTARTKDQLWLDCVPGVIHQDARTNQPETLAQVEMRRKLALNRLKTGGWYTSKRVQAVFNHDNGQTPRPFVSAAVEDGYKLGGHTLDSHVLDGTGVIKNLHDLATRVCTKFPQCPERAGAYTSLSAANSAISKVNAAMQGTWTGDNGYRHKICSANLDPFILPDTTGSLLEKVDAPKTDAYPNNEMKNRGLLPGQLVKNPLTMWVTPTTVHISVGVDVSAPGGWHVVSAYPSLGD